MKTNIQYQHKLMILLNFLMRLLQWAFSNLDLLPPFCFLFPRFFLTSSAHIIKQKYWPEKASQPGILSQPASYNQALRKSDNWRWIYKQTSSTFYTSIDVQNVLRKKILVRHNGCSITFKKYRRSHQRCSIKMLFLKTLQYSLDESI